MWEQGLLDVEQGVARHFSPRRKQEFTAGRNCLRQALTTLGRVACPILVGPGREPVLPAGVVGTITHTASYCAAAVVGRDAGISIGIDAEEAGEMDEDVARLVMTDAERAQVLALQAQYPGRAWAHLVFSAKEALHKALYRRCPSMLDFFDARAEVDVRRATIVLHLAEPAVHRLGLGYGSFEGRWRFAAGLVLTAVVVPLDPDLRAD
jgi:4'-phosphopantetheinyl transferase EntD